MAVLTRRADYRVYSRVGDAKAYLVTDAETGAITWVRYWRDATGFYSRRDAEAALERAKVAEPKRPMCVVAWGTRQASLPEVKSDA